MKKLYLSIAQWWTILSVMTLWCLVYVEMNRANQREIRMCDNGCGEWKEEGLSRFMHRKWQRWEHARRTECRMRVDLFGSCRPLCETATALTEEQHFTQLLPSLVINSLLLFSLSLSGVASTLSPFLLEIWSILFSWPVVLLFSLFLSS